MSEISHPPQQREFFCIHCNGRILIPFSLPSTAGPCPHCKATITSPEPTLPPPPESVAVNQTILPQPPAPPEQDFLESSPSLLAAGPRKSIGIIPALLCIALLIAGIGGVVFYLSKKVEQPPAAVSTENATESSRVQEANYARIGWQADGFKLLGEFIKADGVQEKLSYINNSEALQTRVHDFYGGTAINDSDTPIDSFFVQELSEEDRRRGIFMMTYDQPPQFALKDFFRPIATVEVQYGLEKPGILLSTMASISNFEMQPIKVHAFFKKTPAGLKLDWEIFVQTKYRLFKNFLEIPDFTQAETFRVIIREDVPEKGTGITGSRTYLLADPANVDDCVRLNVIVDSDVGRALSPINWRGSKHTQQITRTATVSLQWTGQPQSPVLEIKRFICWEFLGLGGSDSSQTPENQ